MARPSFFTAAGWRAHRADVAAFHAERLATIALEPLQGNNVMNATRADALRPGDICDLEGDAYADPACTHPAYVFEYATVCEVERETADCVAVSFESGPTIGFPPDHEVKRDPDMRHDTAYDAA